MQSSESIAKLAQALAKAQGEMVLAKRVAENPFLKTHYADLGALLEVIRKPLATHELAVTQLICPDPDFVVIETVLLHASGEWISSTIQLRPGKTDPQGMGSTITYARRYALSAIVSLAAEDNDGEAITGHKAETDRKAGQLERKEQPPATIPVADIIKPIPKKDKPVLGANDLISEAQAKRLFALAQGDTELVREAIHEHDYKSTKDIRRHDYQKISEYIEAHQNPPRPEDHAHGDVRIQEKKGSGNHDKNGIRT